MRPEPIAGRYELVEHISSGGMGQVWRGYDAVLDREVAVKLIRPDVIVSGEQADEFAKRFRREARITARIQHHGVPQVYDAVLDEPYDKVYLVMEYVRGTPLRHYIDPARPLPIAWAVAIAAQIATVFSHAHAIPVVHRDLKPDNVLVCDTGTVKVLDFGIAAILRTDVTRLTATGTPLGTTRYMSPEQINNAQVTPASDLYALGCVLHELLCGRPVFDGSTAFQLMRQHVSAQPQPLRTLRPEVPEALELLVLELLAKAPEQRPADAYEVYERLTPFLPLPGAPAPAAEDAPGGMPDPTLLFRRPNAPRTRPRPTAQPSPSATPPPAPRRAPRETGLVTDAAPAVTATPPAQPAQEPPVTVREAIDSALAHSDALLEQERFAQAAEVIAEAIRVAAAALNPTDRTLLSLRSRRAAILILGGDFRRALPEFDALAETYARIDGPTSDDALLCLRQAAHCRAQLGETTAALRQFRQVLTHVRARSGDASPTALELRRDIGFLLLAESKTTEAAQVLKDLHEDLCLVSGPDRPEAQEVARVLRLLNVFTDA